MSGLVYLSQCLSVNSNAAGLIMSTDCATTSIPVSSLTVGHLTESTQHLCAMPTACCCLTLIDPAAAASTVASGINSSLPCIVEGTSGVPLALNNGTHGVQALPAGNHSLRIITNATADKICMLKTNASSQLSLMSPSNGSKPVATLNATGKL